MTPSSRIECRLCDGTHEAEEYLTSDCRKLLLVVASIIDRLSRPKYYLGDWAADQAERIILAYEAERRRISS